MLEITIFATKIDFFHHEKTSLSGTQISPPKTADLPISFLANCTYIIMKVWKIAVNLELGTEYWCCEDKNPYRHNSHVDKDSYRQQSCGWPLSLKAWGTALYAIISEWSFQIQGRRNMQFYLEILLNRHGGIQKGSFFLPIRPNLRGGHQTTFLVRPSSINTQAFLIISSSINF